MKALTTIAVGLAAACMTAAGLPASPADAALHTRCVGAGGDVTVPGDLVVPRSQACELDGTTITGDVRVARGANLVAHDVTIDGTLTVAKDGYADIDGVDIDGQVTLQQAFGMMANASTMDAGLITRAPDDVSQGFAEIAGSTINGSLHSSAGELIIKQTDIGADVSTDGAYFTEAHDSFVDGKVTVRENEQPSLFCGGAIRGDARFIGNGNDVRLGVSAAPGACQNATYWGGDVRIADTDGDALADNNIVDGNLVLRGNEPAAKLGERNVVRGEIVGDYENADMTSPSTHERAAASRQSEHSKQLGQKAQKRKADALKQVHAAGQADLG